MAQLLPSFLLDILPLPRRRVAANQLPRLAIDCGVVDELEGHVIVRMVSRPHESWVGVFNVAGLRVRVLTIGAGSQ